MQGRFAISKNSLPRSFSGLPLFDRSIFNTELCNLLQRSAEDLLLLEVNWRLAGCRCKQYSNQENVRHFTSHLITESCMQSRESLDFLSNLSTHKAKGLSTTYMDV